MNAAFGIADHNSALAPAFLSESDALLMVDAAEIGARNDTFWSQPREAKSPGELFAPEPPLPMKVQPALVKAYSSLIVDVLAAPPGRSSMR